MAEPDVILSLKGNPIQRKISVDEISFSAHVDYSQNAEFIEIVKAQHVVCVFCSVRPCLYIDNCFRCWYTERRTRWLVYEGP